MSVFFLSDLHLGSANPQVNQYLQSFLQYCHQHQASIDKIFVLGDLFEFWIGDDVPSKECDLLSEQFSQLANLGIELFLIHGNRDFLLGEQFCKKTGMELIADPYVLNIDDQTIILSHGDTLCTDDIAYLQFYQQVRNPEWQQQFLSLPIETRIEQAMKARETSQQNQQGTADKEIISDVNQQAVENLLSEYNANCLIHGHTHRPNHHTFELNGKTAHRYVLSAWYQGGQVLSYQQGQFSLLDFN